MLTVEKSQGPQAMAVKGVSKSCSNLPRFETSTYGYSSRMPFSRVTLK